MSELTKKLHKLIDDGEAAINSVKTIVADATGLVMELEKKEKKHDDQGQGSQQDPPETA